MAPSSEGRLAEIAVGYGLFLNPDLYLMDANGDHIMRLTPGNGSVNSVAWPPDGQKLAFAAANMPDRYQYDIYVVNADGSDLIRLEPELTGITAEYEPSRSPDGKQIVFAKGPELSIMDADGNNARFLTRGNSPSWSPDGQSIAFVLRQEQILYGDIYISDMKGRNLRQLTKDLYADHPVRSSDGRQIAFTVTT